MQSTDRNELPTCKVVRSHAKHTLRLHVLDSASTTKTCSAATANYNVFIQEEGCHLNFA